MALFQVSFSFDGMELDFLEELLYELDEGHWNLYLDHGSDNGVAAGVFSSEQEAWEEWIRVKPHFEELLGSVEPEFEPLAEKTGRKVTGIIFMPGLSKGYTGCLNGNGILTKFLRAMLPYCWTRGWHSEPEIMRPPGVALKP